MPRGSSRPGARLILLLALPCACTHPPAGLHPPAQPPAVRRVAPPAAPAEKLAEPLRSRLRERPVWRVLVELDTQLDLRALARRQAARGLGKRARRADTVAALAAVAARRQARLAPYLERARRRGLVRSWRGYTIVNRLLVEATPAGVEALARHPDVVAIVPETESTEPALALALPGQAEEPGREPAARDGDGQDPHRALDPGLPEKDSWGLAAIGAGAAWALGLDGRGVVVGAIDSGASAGHEQLAPTFRGGPRSWHDPAGGSPSPRDGHLGHGSGVLSCAAGANVAGVRLGVAPGARWIACAGLPRGRYHDVLALDCAEWMLTVGRPDVLLNAWTLPTPACDRSFQPIVDAWRAAEILPVFAAGNHGPAPGSARSPADYADLHPGGRPALAIGGLARDRSPWPESGRGPASCGAPLYPLLVAPAEDLIAAFPVSPSAYLRARGTSYAAALTAGAAALLIQRHPEASISEIEDALLAGASDLAPPGPDDATGHGLLDLPKALAHLDRIRGSSPQPARSSSPSR